MRRTGDRRSRRTLASLAVGVLALVACGEDDGGADDGGEAGQHVLGESEATEPAAEEAQGGDDGTAPANGSVTVGDEQLALDTAYRCPPRETFEGDGQIVNHTFAYGPDDAYGVNVWEQVEGGVRSHRVSSDAPGLSSRAEQIVEEGAADHPLIEIDGDRISVRARLMVEGSSGEEVEVRAEWDLPADTLPEATC